MTKTTIKPYVRITSKMNIAVTSGLECTDVTNPDAHVPDRLKINALWPQLTVLVKDGTHWYPSEITTWNTVKALVKDGILSIGEFSDEATDEVVKEKETLVKKIEEITKKTGKTLNDLTEE